MKDCPFCQKQSKDLILETANFAVIYNLSPILPGHCLIISKEHRESLFEFPEEELSELMILSRKLAEFLGKVFDTGAFNWAIQERENAGQSVAHFHMHVVPRRIGDLEHPGAWYSALERSEELPIDSSARFKLTSEQLDKVTQRLKGMALDYFKDDQMVY